MIRNTPCSRRRYFGDDEISADRRFVRAGATYIDGIRQEQEELNAA